MERLALQFQGARDEHLLAALVAGISAVLLAAGVWHLACRRKRQALVAMATAAGAPVAAAALLIEGAVRYAGGRRREARASLLGGAALGAAVALGAALWLSSSDGGAFWTALVGLQVAAAVGFFYSTVYSYLGTRRLAVLMTLRCLAIAALLGVLFKPALSVTIGDGSDKPLLPILLDRSASMGTLDEASVGDRHAQAMAMLASQDQRLRRFFRPAYHAFGARCVLVESLDALGGARPSGPGADATDIALALRTAAADFRGSPGMVLISDGLHNVQASRLADAAVEAGMPVYAVGVGSASQGAAGRRNIEIASVAAPLEAVKNNVTTITAQLRLTGLTAAGIGDVQLFESPSDVPVATAKVPAPRKNDDKVTVELKWTPRGPGDAASDVRRLRVCVPPVTGESVAEDNNFELHVLVTEPRLRVLYVEGSMRPEYKYLKRQLETDANIQFVSMVRVSGNKFWSQGSIGGKQLSALPASAEDFAMFDVIILGDLDQTFLTPDQMSRLRAFVTGGGGLLVIGGHNSLGPGGYGGTELEQALPVLVGARSQPQETAPFVPALTAPGEGHPIFEGIAGFFAGPGGRAPKADLPKLPELSGCVTVLREKPGATVLAVHPARQGPSGPLIVLAVQQAGAGRSAVFTGDTTWNWYMPLRGLGIESPYQRFWGQMVRWLGGVAAKTKDSPPRVVLRLDQSHMQIAQPLQVNALVRDPRSAQSQQRVEYSMAIEGTSAAPRVAPLAPLKEAAMFGASWQSDKPGRYRVKVTAFDAAGQAIGSDELPLSVAAHSAELDKLARDQASLELVARKSDGRAADLSRLPELIDEIIERQKAQAPAGPQVRHVPLHNFTALFVVFAALLTAEWLLRRNWQLH
jgi:uncharacterized membrane protein